MQVTINGGRVRSTCPPDMPLLWVLRDVLGMTGTKFGCGMALCGACTVHLDGQPIRSCVTPVARRGRQAITTIEAIGETPNGERVQEAWLDLDVVQCGYCQSGQIMSAAALLGEQSASERRRHRRGPWRATSVAAARIRASAAAIKQRVREGSLTMARDSVSRRTFLKASAAAGGGLLLSFAAPRQAAGRGQPSARPPRPDSRPTPSSGSIRTGPSTLIIQQVEIGQSTYTSMPMLIAEELEVALDQVHLEHAPRRRRALRERTARIPGDRRLDFGADRLGRRCAGPAPPRAPCW